MLTVPVPQDLYLKTRSVSSVSSANLERTRLLKKVKRDRKISEPPIHHQKYRYNYFNHYAFLYSKKTNFLVNNGIHQLC